ncbi:hypothetical protein GCM10010168_19600 [Actinoplanes ianthinogenes]|uniref:Uncharacterized protein n=1 Tax=Actinoplanes ianthinogenes TaxID=122358 RepID=A0ABM7M7J3_9ACTN|nr:DUF6153 family protein [Actinoplanes ianthinogenes]BCJ47602.1 hypothetical protein Aiant_82590 [Actinoplanes ianthinogenes]GGR02869.1 hypothetical protein GCM10010168_19600 [Actinoplanes ianthinogenes]
MIGPTAASIGRGARTVLLLCTVLGLALMHTLGHSGVRAEHSGSVAMTSMSATLTAAEDCPDDHCAGGHDHGQLSLWSVCLAVLGGLTVVVLLAMALLVATRSGDRPRGTRGSRHRAGRAPPIPGAGLTLAATAVLRI